MNFHSAPNSLPRATAAAIARPSRHTAAVSFLVLLLILGGGTANAAQMRFGPYTNSIGGNVLTNTYIKVQAVGDPAIDAAGNVTGVVGLPVRILLGPDGKVTNTLQNQNYFVTNNPGDPAYFNKGYVFRAPLDSGPTVYSTTAPGILITGMNYFVTLSGGTNGGSVTFNSVTNGLGYTPLAPTDTNGYIRSLQATNISIALNFALSNTLYSLSAANTTLTFASSNFLYGDYGSKITAVDARVITNAFATNAAGVTYANGRAYVSTNYDALGSALTASNNLLSYTITLSNNLFTQITVGGITSVTATNIGSNLVYQATNSFTSIVRSNGNVFVNTNLLFVTSNSLAGQIGSAGISASTATNISAAQVTLATNGYSSLVFTNASQVLMTNRLPALTNGFVDASYAQSLTNGFIGKVDSTNIFNAKIVAATNSLATTNQVNIKANTNAATMWNLSVHNAITVSGNDGSDTGSISSDRVAMNNLSASASTNIILEDTLQMDFGIGGISDENGHVIITPEGVFYGSNSVFNGTLYITNGTFANLLGLDGVYNRGNTIAPFEYETHNNGSTLLEIGTNSVPKFVLLNSGNLQVQALNIATLKPAAGRSNVVFINPTGAVVTNDLAGFVASIISGTSGGIPPLTNAYGTNLLSGLVTGQRIYFPTNFDALGGSNFLYTAQLASNALWAANKLDKTNGTSYGQNATNLATEGNVSFGFTGQATNIISTTNVVAFFNAGTSLATNGAFIWSSTLGCYTNWITSAILTNNSTAWLMQTNGVSLYSLASASPFGTYSAVSGTGTPTSVSSFVFNHNGMVDVGWFSVTNQTAQSNLLYQIAVAIAQTNSIATLNGNGTNTRFIDPIMDWASTPEINKVDNGAKMNFPALSAGLASTNTGSGFGAAILSGATNRMQVSGASTIAGGMINQIIGGVNNYNFIGGGLSNSVGGVDGASVLGGIRNSVQASYSWIGGGIQNFIAQNIGPAVSLGGNGNTNGGVGSVILGGFTNYTGGKMSIAAGTFAWATNDFTFVWSGADANPQPCPTNSQAVFSATNGLYLNGPLWLNALNTNGGIYILSNKFSLYAVTNTMPNFCHWIGTSNGITVDIYYSNGVSFMKNNWP